MQHVENVMVQADSMTTNRARLSIAERAVALVVIKVFGLRAVSVVEQRLFTKPIHLHHDFVEIAGISN